MSDAELVNCPFCKETEFDLIGLKHHLISNCCPIFEEIEILIGEQ